jgi:tetratricopeptide (TPR) repeat protein
MNFRETFILLLFLTLASHSSTVLNAQQRSRAEALKEAARLATEAERIQGDAIHKVQAGADRKLIRESEKLAVESFAKAIELWREAGDDKRLIAAVDEQTRLCSVIDDYDCVFDRLTREAQYWQDRGNVPEQVHTLYLLGIRQSQMKRYAVAIETTERVVTMSRSARLQQLEPNALLQLSTLYDRVGRLQDAQSARETADKLWAGIPLQPAPQTGPIPPATIPAQWVDLPGAPAAVEYRVLEGVNEAVLVNRSAKGITMVRFGCVALEGDKKTRVLYGLLGLGSTHGVRSGFYYQPFRALNGPLNRWTDEKMGCEGAAKMTLIETQFDDGTMWKADGLNWVP